MSGAGVYWTDSHGWTYGCHQGGRPECAQCWAAAMVHRWERNPAFHLVSGHLTDERGRWTGAVHVREPKPFTVKGRPHGIACNWLGDLFHRQVPQEVIWSALDQVAINAYDRRVHGAEPHAYLFLTHKPARMVVEVLGWLAARTMSVHEPDDHMMMPARGTNPIDASPFWSAVWWGATCTRLGTLHAACEITELSGNHWLSIEPIEDLKGLGIYAEGIDWVAAGTSTTAPELQSDRHVAMLRQLGAECRDGGIPFWLKQCGAEEVQAIDRQMPDSIRRAFMGGPRLPAEEE